MPRLLIASPHRYPDLARLWHRFVLHELVPGFERIGLDVEVNIFRDANADQFRAEHFPRVRFTQSGPGLRDFMEFYDGTLCDPCEFVLFLDADTFVLDGAWAGSYFRAFDQPDVAAVSYVPRKGTPAIFALLCRAESYRALPAPALACRYEFPDQWPHGVNLQPGEFATRELTNLGKIIINIAPGESSRHTANFRGTTGLRSSREQITHAVGEQVFLKSVAASAPYLVAAYDNMLLGALYEALYGEPFAADGAGNSLAGSLTRAEFRNALAEVRDIESLRSRFAQSERNILRMAAQEGKELFIPSF
ncbi:MAG TPA: hypothetical protein VFW44_15260 [Bryobacteraceae bacterium]|nr:hypothetical protein [Bryobacteraceae bacterium]